MRVSFKFSIAGRALALVLVGFSGIVPAFSQTPSATLPNYSLVWQDEFDGSMLDTTKWTIRTGTRRNATNSATSGTSVHNRSQGTLYPAPLSASSNLVSPSACIKVSRPDTRVSTAHNNTSSSDITSSSCDNEIYSCDIKIGSSHNEMGSSDIGWGSSLNG